jgi:hypothetical protein
LQIHGFSIRKTRRLHAAGIGRKFKGVKADGPSMSHSFVRHLSSRGLIRPKQIIKTLEND